MILADRQSKGRGRQNRRWISPEGGIWLSIILKPTIPAKKSLLLNYAAALAVSETITQETGLESRIKLPNDIIINQKKVCGILLDIATKGTSIEYAVIGIGINANVNIQKILPYIDGNEVNITSLQHELSGKSVNKQAFLTLLFEKFEYYYSRLENEDMILDQTKNKLASLKALVAIQHASIEGVIIDLCSDGSLVLKRQDGTSITVNCNDARIM